MSISNNLWKMLPDRRFFEEKCEWIILNADPDGEDFDEEVILGYVEKYPNNIVYKRLQEDPGIYDTWNMAIKNVYW